MRLGVATALVALCWAGSASADVPAGFRLNVRLAPAASFVAGKPVSVYCAPNAAAMNALAGPGAYDTQGYTPVIGGNVIYLSSLTCSYLDAWLNGKKPGNLYGVAGSMQTIAHEAEHTTGIRDETDADCASLKAMVPMVTRFFPLKKRITMHDLMGLAWLGHDHTPAVYREHAC